MATAAIEPGTNARDLRRPQLLTIGAAVLIVAAVAAGVRPLYLMALMAGLAGFAATHRWLLQWRTLLLIIIAAILFIPMKRYTLFPGSLPFQLEPYRIIIACVALGWIGTLLIDPATRVRRIGADGPFWAFIAAILLSVAANAGRVTELGVNDVMLKKVTFLLSFCVIAYLVSSTISRRRDLDALVKLLVGGGAVITLAALFESRTGVNWFDHLQRIVPPLKFTPEIVSETAVGRGGRLRVFASAEHPIALSAALAMLIPLGIYLGVKTRRWHWWAATALLGLGVVATLSRTGILMLLAMLIVYAILRPAATRRALPAVLPLLIVVHMALPGALGALKNSFLPEGGLLAEQEAAAGTRGSGRLADLGPGLAEWSRRPFFGQGYGTRITDSTDPRENAPILDNQWLHTLLEGGVFAFLALIWLFRRAVRQLGRSAKHDQTAHGWLLTGLAASISAFGVGMFTFDAFSFSQVTFLFFIALGLAGAALRGEDEVLAVSPT
jgi:hypothetical protein